ncbi:MAG: lyase family protein [Desulfobacterales bacterium]|nr:lyase family protein [Desulfobacterales bacterium]
MGVFQTGSGTSSNMNAQRGDRLPRQRDPHREEGRQIPVHPNDHVNLGQSSNDAVPSAIHIAALVAIRSQLVPALRRLHQALSAKARGVRRCAQDRPHPPPGRRAHDPGPGVLRLRPAGGAGRSSGWQAVEPRLAELRPRAARRSGTGVNAHPEFAAETIAWIARETGIGFRKAGNHFEAQAARDAAVEASGALKTVAVSLTKIANDIRWLGSGPRCGLGEIVLPSLQPGSSIMPGKVNPVIPEAVLQVAAQVIGNDATITLRRAGRQLRAQRDDAGDRLQPAAVHRPAGGGGGAFWPRNAWTASPPTARPAPPSSRAAWRWRRVLSRASATTVRPRWPRRPTTPAGRCARC